MRFQAASAAVSLALCLVVATAHAQGGDTATADRLFREGRALLKQGSYEEACSKLEESHRLDPAPGTAINLGDCFEKQGKVASALLAYQAARDLLKPGDPRVHPVKQQITALEKRTPRLTIKLAPGAPEGTEVKRDGRTVEPTKLGAPIAVNPGQHEIVVKAPGRAGRVYHAELDEGETRDIAVDAGNAELNDAELNDAPVAGSGVRGSGRRAVGEAPDNASQRTAGFVVGGAGLVGFAIAIPTYVYVKNKESATADGVAGAKEDGERVAPFFYVATGVAVVGLALGGYLLLTSSDEAETALALQPSSNGAAAVLHGRF